MREEIEVKVGDTYLIGKVCNLKIEEIVILRVSSVPEGFFGSENIQVQI